MKENIFPSSRFLPDEFLANLLLEVDNDIVTAIILHGSYARGNALLPYSDIDLVRIIKETAYQPQQKQFIYRDGYLISISTRPLSVYRERFSLPEKAIFAVPSVQEARILVDKEDAFRTFQQETKPGSGSRYKRERIPMPVN